MFFGVERPSIFEQTISEEEINSALEYGQDRLKELYDLINEMNKTELNLIRAERIDSVFDTVVLEGDFLVNDVPYQIGCIYQTGGVDTKKMVFCFYSITNYHENMDDMLGDIIQNITINA